MTGSTKVPQGRRLFSFAVVADTHVNESDTSSQSPFRANILTNDRARHVFNEIAAMNPSPDFVVHLGDMIHPVPNMPGYDEAARKFKEIAAQVAIPVHLVPGNHDIGDKTIDWMPADIVCNEYVTKYQQTFGKDYYAFKHADLHFVILNALLFNSGLRGEEEQKQWFDAELAAGGRVFVFLHYPPYLYEANERSSYENIDEPGRSWLLERLRGGNVEGIFAGHVHNFWYDVVGNAEMYLLPSTAFLRHDFTEFYRVLPGADHGRSDTEKYGYFVVDVHERGHVARLIRTHGATLAHDAVPIKRRVASSVHTKTSVYPRFGVELRHAWSEVVQIPATGGIEEFGRKIARNDYQLMALWEMGVKTLKVPQQDLLDPATLHRAELMSDVGHEFIVTALSVPKEAFVDRMNASRARVSAIELNLTMANCVSRSGEIARLRERGGPRVILCKLRTHEDSKYDGKQFGHSINTGFRLAELADASEQIRQLLRDRVIDGITVRVDFDDDIVIAAKALGEFADRLRCDVIASVKLAIGNLSTLNGDEFGTARRAAEALVASRAHSRVSFVFDTFMDVDRGYFPRVGFIDRRFNPRTPAAAIASLVAVLAQDGDLRLGELALEHEVRVSNFSIADSKLAICSGSTSAVGAHLERNDCGEVLNLLTREILSKRADTTWESALSAAGEPSALVLAL